MTINLSMPATHQLKPRITVVGVGGAGGNAVNNMITSHLEGVEFVVANTDAQALAQSLSERRIQLGVSITQGLGAGSQPDVGRAAAEEAIDEILENLDGSNMVFITAGMGGGTGTGGAPVVARAAREQGVLTVGVVTKPFQFEGVHRMRLAEEGLAELQQYVDTLIIIPNQNLFRVANEKTTFADAFKMADNVLYSGVRGVTDLMVMPGLINLDFADVRSVMAEMGKAMMGTGEADGDRRALDAAEAAIANPLLDDTSMMGAKGVLINITGGPDITLFEVDEAASRIREEVDQDAYIIFGSAFDSELEGRIRVSVIATGINANASTLPQPKLLTLSDPTSSYRVPRLQSDQVLVPGVLESTGEVTEEETEVLTVDADGTAEAAANQVADQEGKPEQAKTAEDKDATKIVGEEMSTSATDDEPPDAFIPRPAVCTKVEHPEPKSDPFAAAAMTNGGNNPSRAADPGSSCDAKPSLFERVTRTGRAAVSQAADPWPEETGEVMENKNVSDTSEEPAATPVVESPMIAGIVKRIPKDEQLPEPEIAAVDDELAAKDEDEKKDLLDIPAFLRRQAN